MTAEVHLVTAGWKCTPSFDSVSMSGLVMCMRSMTRILAQPCMAALNESLKALDRFAEAENVQTPLKPVQLPPKDLLRRGFWDQLVTAKTGTPHWESSVARLRMCVLYEEREM
mmetsp:Transcript_43579/g.70755  ORF Transcript_43579/g.70755 Transcript_43579/m.70755 type:complete len:113 (+) Transcript_43579:197-535(+)